MTTAHGMSARFRVRVSFVMFSTVQSIFTCILVLRYSTRIPVRKMFDVVRHTQSLGNCRRSIVMSSFETTPTNNFRRVIAFQGRNRTLYCSVALGTCHISHLYNPVSLLSRSSSHLAAHKSSIVNKPDIRIDKLQILLLFIHI